MPETGKEDPDVLELIRDESWDEVPAALATMHPMDIAEIINRAPSQYHEQIFTLVPVEIKPDVLAELKSVAGSEILDAMTDSEISDIVEEMAPDDAADILGDLSETRSEHVLALMEAEESEDVRRLLEYEEDTAGGIMTTDVVSMHENQTVEEALQAIAYLDTRERFSYAYIVDEPGRLTGYIDIWELLRERNRGRPLGELAHRDFVTATVDMDQEEVAQMTKKYDLTALPVTDPDGVLVGRVTADDVIDVIEEEASEDIFRLAGSDDAELESPSALRSCMVRLPWLLITLLGGAVVSVILREFHSHISGMLILGAFVPIVLAMGGNTGIQSSTLVVRSIALGDFKGTGITRLLLREILTGAIMGGVCGLLIGVWVRFLAGSSAADMPSTLHLSAIVALALFASMTFAAVFGAFVPIALNRINVDPAVASGPFITITNDIIALLIYFLVTMSLVQTTMPGLP